MTSDEQEALSNKYGNKVVMILPLKSGRIAVFNSARELCAVVEDLQEAFSSWHPPAAISVESTINGVPKRESPKSRLTMDDII